MSTPEPQLPLHGLPARSAPALDLLSRAATLGELRDRLRRAIEQEQFELAADLRDRIRVLECST